MLAFGVCSFPFFKKLFVFALACVFDASQHTNVGMATPRSLPGGDAPVIVDRTEIVADVLRGRALRRQALLDMLRSTGPEPKAAGVTTIGMPRPLSVQSLDTQQPSAGPLGAPLAPPDASPGGGAGVGFGDVSMMDSVGNATSQQGQQDSFSVSGTLVAPPLAAEPTVETEELSEATLGGTQPRMNRPAV